MLVSVVIPTYNRSASVYNAILSVLSQTYRDLELIVVDDGSTDNTYQILMNFHDSRLRLVRQDHQGVAAARNYGVSLAQGDYIAFLDSDDVWMPHKLERQISFTLEGEWEITQTDELWIRRGKKVNPKFRHSKRAGWLFEPSLYLCLVSPSCVFLSRKCWENVGPFDQNLLACEDYDLWLRTSLFFPVGYLPEKLVWKYGGHSDQLSRQIVGIDLYRIYSLCKLIKHYPLTPEQRMLVTRNLELRVKYYIQGCLKRDKIAEAERIKRLTQDILRNI